jgi:hypothetical protein
MDLKLNPNGIGDSYVSLADADAFHALRATALWTPASDAQRSAALVRASDYIDAHYRLLQADTLPPCIVRATLTLAPDLIASAPAVEADNREVIEETLIGPAGLQKTTKWTAVSGSNDPFPLITSMLTPALVPRPGWGVVQLVR